MHAVKRQERMLRAKLRLQQGEDEDLAGGDREDEEEDGMWGGRKRAYYGEAKDEACSAQSHSSVHAAVQLVPCMEASSRPHATTSWRLMTPQMAATLRLC